MARFSTLLSGLALPVLLSLTACDDGTGKTSADFTESDALGPTPRGEPATYPIVLAHGFDASPTNRWGFYRVAEALEADGHEVYVAIVPPYDSPEVRAVALADVVDGALADGHEKVNVIAHSMGGLDARHMISQLGYGDVVASLTTISSPHRGSKVADTMLKVLDGVHADDDLVDGLASAWGVTFNDLAEDSHVRAALEGISEGRSGSFNEENPDDANVHYQSWAGVSSAFGIKNPRDKNACEGQVLGNGRKADKMNATLLPMAAIVGGFKLTPNDGMVSVESAKWGDFRGCIPADHLDEVGQMRHDEPDGRTKFDHVRFYRNVAFELADMGF
jgi:triacylglycerol lipase